MNAREKGVKPVRKLAGELMGIRIYVDDDPFYTDNVVVDAGCVELKRIDVASDGRVTVQAVGHPERVTIFRHVAPGEPS